MRTKTVGSILTILLAPVVFGQTAEAPNQERVIHINNATTVQELQEMATAIRTTTEVRDMAADNATNSITVRGNPEQIAAVEWLAAQLDRPVGAVAAGVPEYKGLADVDQHRQPTTDSVIHVHYLTHAATVQDFQEIANAARTTTEIRRMFAYNDGRAIVVRGTAEQMRWADWLLHELDQSTVIPASQRSAVLEFTLSGDDVMRLFYIPNAKTVQGFQEIANAIRTITEIRRAFTYNTGRVLSLRGTPEQLAMASWLIPQLDTATPPSQASGEFRMAGTGDDILRVFHLPRTATAQEFQGYANQIRTTFQIRRVFTYNDQRAIAVRGTANQLALTDDMVQRLNQGASIAQK